MNSIISSSPEDNYLGLEDDSSRNALLLNGPVAVSDAAGRLSVGEENDRVELFGVGEGANGLENGVVDVRAFEQYCLNTNALIISYRRRRSSCSRNRWRASCCQRWQ